MTKEEIYNRLNEVFQDVFDDEGIVVVGSTTSDDIEDWDSLEHINLVVSIEKEFDIKFNIGEVNAFNNVGDMVDVIVDKIRA